MLSDPVPGAAEIFDGCVRFCAEPAEGIRLLREPFDDNWPDRARRLEVADRVRGEHSFDRRAEELLSWALRLFREKRADGPRRNPAIPVTSW